MEYTSRERGTIERGATDRGSRGESWLGTASARSTRETQTPTDPLRMIESTSPRPFFYATIASIALSAGLYVAGRRMAGIFVGLWAPTFISLALYLRMMRQIDQGR